MICFNLHVICIICISHSHLGNADIDVNTDGNPEIAVH